jgi:hypothetical protein
MNLFRYDINAYLILLGRDGNLTQVGIPKDNKVGVIHELPLPYYRLLYYRLKKVICDRPVLLL